MEELRGEVGSVARLDTDGRLVHKYAMSAEHSANSKRIDGCHLDGLRQL